MEAWRFVVRDGHSATAQMAIDEELARVGAPTVRLFRWNRPAVSWGFRQQPPGWVEETVLSAYGIEVVERPTGGGLAIHGTDLSCSVVIPTEAAARLRDIMAALCEVLTAALRVMGVEARWLGEGERSARVEYCLTQESPYAVLVGDRKVCGLAVRRYRTARLVQGSMLIRPLLPVFLEVMPSSVVDEFRHRAIALEQALGRPVSDDELTHVIREAWSHCRVGGLQLTVRNENRSSVSCMSNDAM